MSLGVLLEQGAAVRVFAGAQRVSGVFVAHDAFVSVVNAAAASSRRVGARPRPEHHAFRRLSDETIKRGINRS
jgi:hypothetical protein